MGIETLLIVAGALAGGFVNGLTGFGTGMTALVLWLHVLAPAVAAPLVVVCSVVAQLQSLPAIRHAIDLRRRAPCGPAPSARIAPACSASRPGRGCCCGSRCPTSSSGSAA